MFLTAVLCMSLGIVTNTSIADSGHCHDLGNGIYVDTDHVNLVGWHWHRAQVKPSQIYNGHYTNLSQVKQDYPDCKIVLIDVSDLDIVSMTRLRFHKTMNPMSRREYDKFVDKFDIADWPTYNELIQNPSLVEHSITAYDALWFKQWQQEIDHTLVDIKIPFSSLFETGFDTVNSLLGLNTNATIQKFVDQYQEINFNLYKS